MSSSLPSQDIETQEAEPRLLDLPPGTRADRLDKVLAQLLPEHSRSRLQGWIERGGVQVNGKEASVRQVVGPGDQLTVWEEAAPESLAFTPEAIDFPVVADSTDWIVIDKPVGLVVHPGRATGTDAAQRPPAPLSGAGPGAACRHRTPIGQGYLGTDGGGAHHDGADLAGAAVAGPHRGRRYLALVSGHVRRGGTIDRPIGRDPRVPVRMSVERPIAAKPAVTHFEPLRLGRAPGGMPVTEVECRLETGRTHQIRVHMASIGHPLLADTLYGGKAVEPAARQMLHAARLQFDDPVKGEPRVFRASVPDDMQAVVRVIAWDDGEQDVDDYLDEEDEE